MRYFIILACGLISPIASSEVQHVTVSHTEADEKLYYTGASPGDVIKVKVTDTCDEFVEKHVGMELGDERAISWVTVKGQLHPNSQYLKELLAKYSWENISEQGDGSQDAADEKSCEEIIREWAQEEGYCESTERTFSIAHDGSYAGYRIKLENTSGTDVKKRTAVSIGSFCSEQKEDFDAAKADLHKYFSPEPIAGASLVLIANKSPWTTDFSGGLAVSWLTDPRFYIDDSNKIARSSASEDSHDLVFAAFAHARNRNCVIPGSRVSCSNVALTAGLGTQGGESLDYFLGMSYKLGSAFVTVGTHWGQVDRLKNGIVVGAEVTEGGLESDVISDSNLASKRDWALFLSASWTFGGDAKGAFSNGITNIKTVSTNE